VINEARVKRLEKIIGDKSSNEYKEWMNTLSRDEMKEHGARVEMRLAEIGIPVPKSPDWDDLTDEVYETFKNEVREWTQKVWLAGRYAQLKVLEIEEWRAYQKEGHPART